ncbi:MAG: hypothetical protein COB66_03555 [Coxiella sp. (in: Bacteria)]|nr:MAG: hypothetical protein COB66_03555 [Coxiella sp. (in: g-proteobacteria)]
MSAKHLNSKLGAVYITLCCLSSAASFVFIAHLNRHHDAMLSMAVTFGYATILFSLFNIKKLPVMFRIMRQNLKPMIYLNTATLFSWFGTFMALQYIPPATKISIGFGLIAITNFFIAIPLNKLKHHKHLIFCVLFIVLNMALVVFQFSYTAHHVTTRDIVIGVAWSVVGGVIGGFIAINATKLHDVGYTSTQILATRFYLLVIVSLIVLFCYGHATPIHIAWKYYLLSTLLIVILPLLMYHLSIESLGALVTSLVEPFTPVITYFLQIFFLGYRFNIVTLFLLSIASVGIIVLARVEHNATSKKQRAVKLKDEVEQSIV